MKGLIRITGLFILASGMAPLMAANPMPGSTVSVAAAANLVYALDALDAEFQRANPGVAVTSMTGSSGSIVAQIIHGAPYDVFLSADATFPRKLIEAHKADATGLCTFAYGRLVLWSAFTTREIPDIASFIRDPGTKRLAMANAETAPFGRAARQALGRLGLWEIAQPKIILGENVGQAAQFVETGNAEAGFVALSIVISPKLRGKGRWIEVPSNLYDSLEQCAIVTEHGAHSAVAARYLAFLNSTAARRILGDFGYRTPPGP